MIIILNAEQININNFILEIYDLNGNLIKKDVLYGQDNLLYLDNLNFDKYMFVIIKDNGKVLYSSKINK